ncbi:MAG: alpha/beta hydrolase family protein [Gaiellaceae bacterium]
MRVTRMLAALAAFAALLAVPAQAAPADRFQQVIDAILADPYQPAYVPVGLDTAFPMEPESNPNGVPNTFPAQDYTTGSVPGNPDHPDWPTAFKYKRFLSGDGAPLRARLALHPGSHPGVAVVHGFNTNGKESVIRWAAMLYANGYNVLAADQRDFRDEWNNNTPANPEAWPTWLQTFGWKESEDVLAHGRYLASQPGVTSIGLVGFSLGGQDVVLGAAQPGGDAVFDAVLNFSGPADQNAQIYSTAEPPGCTPPACDYPVTDALILLVVPPYGSGGKYDDPCEVLVDAGVRYGTTPAAILAQEKAYKKQVGLAPPLLSFYANDDSLVQPFHATMMAGYESGLQRTFLIERGEHAYFFDRRWQQRAILAYFKGMLPGAELDPSITVNATVNQTPGGMPLRDQLVDLGDPTPAEADALQAPTICPGAPTSASVTSFAARVVRGGVVLRWRTAGEAQTLGFHLYRERGGVKRRINRALVPARGLRGRPSAGYEYSFAVRGAAGARYWLEEVRVDGTRRERGPVRAGR